MNKTPIKAILFDNDGVLVSTEESFFRANNYVLKTYFPEKNIEQSYDDFAYYCMGASGGSERFLADNHFLADEIATFRQHRNQYYLELITDQNLAKPGVLATIKTLEKNYPLAVVTNSSRQHFMGVHQVTQLLPYFQTTITRDDVTHPKPDPEPYQLALAHLNITANEALVIEDSSLGIAAAKAAGIFTIGIRDPFNHQADISAADLALDNITQVIDFLAAEI